MKKLMMMAVAGMFIFASCGGNKAKEAPEQQECQKDQHECCKEMTPEQKADMEAWNNWDEQTMEKKAELVSKKKACIDKCMAEKEAKKAECTEVKEECPEKAEKCAAFKAKWDNWDNLDVEAQKALIDEIKENCHKNKKCDKEQKECKDKE